MHPVQRLSFFLFGTCPLGPSSTVCLWSPFLSGGVSYEITQWGNHQTRVPASQSSICSNQGRGSLKMGGKRSRPQVKKRCHLPNFFFFSPFPLKVRNFASVKRPSDFRGEGEDMQIALFHSPSSHLLKGLAENSEIPVPKDKMPNRPMGRPIGPYIMR